MLKPTIFFSFALIFLYSCSSGIETPNQGSASSGERILINHLTRDIHSIPESSLNAAKNQLHIAYNHTSHGSQLITGMNAISLYPDFEGNYAFSTNGGEGVLDLRDNGISPSSYPDLSKGDSVNADGDTPWVVDTRAFLDNPANQDINVIVWSWCSINGHDAQRYVDNMEKLIAEYPHIYFIFMTGHAERQGEDTTPNSVHYNNQLIRQHCEEYQRHLYDFADIEAYNPDGQYFWNQNMADNLAYGSGGNWAVEWIQNHPDHELSLLTTGAGVDDYDGCQGTSHSSSPQEANLNGILKGMAAWHLWAAIADHME